MQCVDWAREQFDLLPGKAAYWRRREALIIADPHFGKTDHFRQAGIPVPSGATRSNLGRLDALLDATGASWLIILGDLFHARGGVTDAMIDALRGWRRSRAAVRITVVAGNHDRHAGPPPEDLGMDCLDEQLTDGRLILRHDPVEVADRFVMAGHLHPAVRLVPDGAGSGGAARRPMRVPCFHFAPRVAVLPAFGSFTGTHVIRPRRGDRIFVVGPDHVLDVTPAA